ncbi:hypothetical protein CDO73_01355 [Saccharibacillus sp. O23]|uniref:beta-ketoacyl synthase N-terminal-like domain-containing protein n=1 Tax=Saccharibacillus sp. O23 TaxID=2009338 RepID=UPI000B4E2690|nr:beta-ketoacyl synthase N-terminal-like domain-containing protein [Saccharibacillus sp. O23]OWR33180.1 hypothetical protein CDO73_01355 [Saccharibacillus sp. O23]
MRIVKTGWITPAGNDEETIWNALRMTRPNLAGPQACQEPDDRQGTWEPEGSGSGSGRGRKNALEGLPKKGRRASRFSHLGLCAARSAIRPEWIGDRKAERIGAVFTTAYGPLETNMEFARQMIGDEPDLCSPSLFANTVHNACLGTISMDLGIKGPSTMLLGSNHLLLTRLLLAEGKADLILAGAIEEYNEELERSLHIQGMEARRVDEAAVVLALAADDAALPGLTAEDADIRIGETFSFGLGIGAYGLLPSGLAEETGLVGRIERFLRKYRPDAVLGHASWTTLGQAERRAIETSRACEDHPAKETSSPMPIAAGSYAAEDRVPQQVSAGMRTDPSAEQSGGARTSVDSALSEPANMSDGFYEVFGHCLGSDLTLKAAAAKLCLERGQIPAALGGSAKAPERIAVLSAEATGNYSIAIVEKRPGKGR